MKVDADLAPMERRVFRLFVLEGATNMAIAEQLERSESAIKQHMTRLLKKFGCDRREELLVRFYQHAMARLMNDVVGVETDLNAEAQLTRDIEGLLVQMFDGEEGALGMVFNEEEESAVPLKTTRKRGKRAEEPKPAPEPPEPPEPPDPSDTPYTSDTAEATDIADESDDTEPGPPATPSEESAPAKRKTILRKRQPKPSSPEAPELPEPLRPVPGPVPSAVPSAVPPPTRLPMPKPSPQSASSSSSPPLAPVYPIKPPEQQQLSDEQAQIVLLGLEGPIGFAEAPKKIGEDFGPKMHKLVLAGLFERFQGDQQ